jgi:hypothetical protein
MPQWESGVAAPSDSHTLRWVVRRGDPGVGTFVFINNWERLITLPPKTLVRLQLDINSTVKTTISIPSVKSAPLTIESGVWAMWPVVS